VQDFRKPLQLQSAQSFAICGWKNWCCPPAGKARSAGTIVWAFPNSCCLLPDVERVNSSVCWKRLLHRSVKLVLLILSPCGTLQSWERRIFLLKKRFCAVCTGVNFGEGIQFASSVIWKPSCCSAYSYTGKIQLLRNCKYMEVKTTWNAADMVEKECEENLFKHPLFQNKAVCFRKQSIPLTMLFCP